MEIESQVKMMSSLWKESVKRSKFEVVKSGKLSAEIVSVFRNLVEEIETVRSSKIT
jgi:lipid II:glycine glycyltransferase (peptidoglycan interpeptide bridge formation enzyme)